MNRSSPTTALAIQQKKRRLSAKRKQVKRACENCRKAHSGCDEERPCHRCKKRGEEDKCLDMPRKKRKRTNDKNFARRSKHRCSDDDDDELLSDTDYAVHGTSPGSSGSDSGEEILPSGTSPVAALAFDEPPRESEDSAEEDSVDEDEDSSDDRSSCESSPQYSPIAEFPRCQPSQQLAPFWHNESLLLQLSELRHDSSLEEVIDDMEQRIRMDSAREDLALQGDDSQDDLPKLWGMGDSFALDYERFVSPCESSCYNGFWGEIAPPL